MGKGRRILEIISNVSVFGRHERLSTRPYLLSRYLHIYSREQSSGPRARGKYGCSKIPDSESQHIDVQLICVISIMSLDNPSMLAARFTSQLARCPRQTGDNESPECLGKCLGMLYTLLPIVTL